MRTIVLCAVSFAPILGGCHGMMAGHPPDSPAVSPEARGPRREGRVDPVCGKLVQNFPTDVLYVSWYQGVEYHFDSDECRQLFEENPEPYTLEAR